MSVVHIQVQIRSSAAAARMPSTCSGPRGSRTTIRPSRLAAIFPSLPLNREGGMQSRVITTGEPLLVNDVPEQVRQPGGVYYDVDREGHMRKIPEEGPSAVRAAMMLPVKHEGEVVGVVQLMNADSEYDQEQLELAEGLAGLRGAAARHAQLHTTATAEAT